MAARALAPEERRILEDSGARILGYLPAGGYMVRLRPGSEEVVRSLPFIVWLGSLPSHMKVHPELAGHAERSRIAAEAGEKESISLRVLLIAGEPQTRVEQVLAGHPQSAAPSGAQGAWRLEATVPAGLLPVLLSRLAGLPEVEWIEPVRRMRLLNQDAVWVHQSFVGPSPQQTPLVDRGIFGCGQTIGLADSGLDYSACYFQDPNGPPPISICLSAPCPLAAPSPGRRKTILYYNWSGTPTGDDDTCPGIIGGSGHGTHTSGSITGDRSPFADCAGFTTAARTAGDGQAPGAKMIMQEMGDGLEYLNSLGGSLWNLADVAYRSGVRIQSHSWGGGCEDLFGCVAECELQYDSFARDADLAMWTYPDLLLTTSAGNAGGVCLAPQAVTTPAIAKNLVSVGGVGHGANAIASSAFSSPGPVFDGRLKPTVAAQAEAVVSAASDASATTANCSTCSLEGTSMASPTVAGLAALVREYFTAGYYATGARNPAQGMTPSGALIKAMLIDGAVGLASGAAAPDFEGGYGRVLLGPSLPFTGSSFQLRVLDHRDGLVQGAVATRAWDVSAGTPLHFTLVWTDFPAALNAVTARVNELRLEVVDPAGGVWHQTLDADSGLPAVTSDPNAPHDSVNVEERMVFDAPMAGRWIVRVVGVDVPMGPQPFALVARGALTDCPAPAAPGTIGLATPADNQVQVSWPAVPGAVAYHVERSLGACPAGPWQPAGSGISGTSFLDSGISGGTAWSYRVKAASGSSGECESVPSACASVVPTGDCFLAPAFAGAQTALSAGSSGCAVQLVWAPASPRCGGGTVYNIYRGTTAGFVPGPASRIARCVNGTGYTDMASLASGVTYHYVVRSEDATTGHGGPCHGGNEDTNAHVVAAAPLGPPVLGTFQDDAGDTGTAGFTTAAPWTIVPTGGSTAPRVYEAASAAGICAALTSPAMALAEPATGPVLVFRTRYDLQYDPIGFFGAEGSLGQVEIATGPAFNNWTRLPLSPDYPAPVEFPLNNCATTGGIETYFSGTSAGYDTFMYDTHTASLANWGGDEVKVRFLLSGDFIYPSGTWAIDDIQITQAITPGACTTLTSGPPPIPDGATVPGQPLQVARSGSDLLLTWDTATCTATAVNVYWGNLGSYGSFAGGFCDLPPTGSATVSLAGNVWMLVVATDGAGTDGSWSRDGSGAELSYSGASSVCPAITAHIPTGGCP
jgi:hypothetical protein